MIPFPFQRHEEILKLLETERSMTVHNLAKKLYISEVTLRRDLSILEKKGYVHRLFGGVTLAKYYNENLPIEMRERKNLQFKKIVAEKASRFLRDGSVIIMDGSTTVKMLLRYINSYKNITIITNNLEIINSIESSNITVFSTGGNYNVRNQVFTGYHAENMLKSIHADMLFFSAQGYSEGGEITDSSEMESAIRRVMLSRADKKVFLCDHTKLNSRYLFRICDGTDVDHIVCDIELSPPADGTYPYQDR